MGYTRRRRMQRGVGQKSKRQQSSTFNSRSRRKRQKQKILRRSLKGGVKKRKNKKKKGTVGSTLYRGNVPTSPLVLSEQEVDFTEYVQSLTPEQSLDPNARVFVPAHQITTSRSTGWAELLKRLEEEKNTSLRNHVFEESNWPGICKCGQLRRNHI